MADERDDLAPLARRLAGPQADPEAEAELYRRLAPRVRLYGLRHLRDPAAAEDLMQDVLLLVLDHLRTGRVREPDRLASYVLGTCRKMVAGQRRARNRREDLLQRFGVDLRPAAARVPDLSSARLEDCLRRLDERARSVVVLSFYAERDAPEIAAELGTSGGHVRVLRHRALARLRSCLEVPA